MSIIINTTSLLCFQTFYPKTVELQHARYARYSVCMLCVFIKYPLTENVPQCKAVNNHMKNCANSE